jgi:hypothetical protein
VKQLTNLECSKRKQFEHSLPCEAFAIQPIEWARGVKLMETHLEDCEALTGQDRSAEASEVAGSSGSDITPAPNMEL